MDADALWRLQTLRAVGSVSVTWHNVLAGHIEQAYIIALPATLILQNCHYHPGQLRGVLSSVELAVLSACLPSSCTSSRILKGCATSAEY